MNNVVALQQPATMSLSELASDLDLMRSLATHSDRRRTLPVMLRGAAAHLGASIPNTSIPPSVDTIASVTEEFIVQNHQASEQMNALLLAIAICCHHSDGIGSTARHRILSMIDRAAASIS